MRQTISGLVAAIAVMAASAAPAMACGGLFDGGCSPCGYVSPCAADLRADLFRLQHRLRRLGL